MKVLVACEYSGRVRDAFIKRGHDAISCDLLPTDSPGPHYQGDMFDLPLREYDLIIAHPPCTAICVSGNRHYAGTRARLDGVEFVKRIWGLPVGKMCIENPVGVINTHAYWMPKPQYVQPWMFGHKETKKTGLWLRGLPNLTETNNVKKCLDLMPNKEKHKIWYASPGPNRWKLRSTTFQGIASAMADQWG